MLKLRGTMQITSKKMRYLCAHKCESRLFVCFVLTVVHPARNNSKNLTKRNSAQSRQRLRHTNVYMLQHKKCVICKINLKFMEIQQYDTCKLQIDWIWIRNVALTFFWTMRELYCSDIAEYLL